MPARVKAKEEFTRRSSSQVCDPDTPHGKWIAHMDVVEDGTKLKARERHASSRLSLERSETSGVASRPPHLALLSSGRAARRVSPYVAARAPRGGGLVRGGMPHDFQVVRGHHRCATAAGMGRLKHSAVAPPLALPPTTKLRRLRRQPAVPLARRTRISASRQHVPERGARPPAGYHDTDLAETFFSQDLNRIGLEKLLCRELTNACTKPTPPLPAGTCSRAQTCTPFSSTHRAWSRRRHLSAFADAPPLRTAGRKPGPAFTLKSEKERYLDELTYKMGCVSAGPCNRISVP